MRLLIGQKSTLDSPFCDLDSSRVGAAEAHRFGLVAEEVMVASESVGYVAMGRAVEGQSALAH
jgi:hypothetical protein